MMVKKQEKKSADAGASPRYMEGVGRRKTAVARVRIAKGKAAFRVNEKDVNVYFPIPRLMKDAIAPLERLKRLGEYSVSVHVSGGGPSAQAGAVRHGLARALVKAEEELKKQLRALGFLTRDSRMVERKKYGLKKARRAPQWQKR